MDESFTSTVTFEGGPESLRTFPRIRLTLRVAGGEMGGGRDLPHSGATWRQRGDEEPGVLASSQLRCEENVISFPVISKVSKKGQLFLPVCRLA